MAAPKGNQYWHFQNKHGRDFKYTPTKYRNEAIKYFEYMSTQVWNRKEAIKSGELAGTLIDIPTRTPLSVGSFCLFVDIDQNTYYRYLKEKGYEAFWEIATRIDEIIKLNQLEGATVGAYNPNIMARVLGLVDKKEMDFKGTISDLKLPDYLEKKK